MITLSNQMESPFISPLLESVGADPACSSEMEVAKSEFERITGKILSNLTSYEMRIRAFHNWYVLERPLSTHGKLPLYQFIERHQSQLTEHQKKQYLALEFHVNSVFELLKVSKEKVAIRDIISGEKYQVPGSETLKFIDRDTLFQTRVFFHEQHSYLSNYLIIHPSSVTKRIKKQAKLVYKGKIDQGKFLHQLYLYQSRLEQYSQVTIESIYHFEK